MVCYERVFRKWAVLYLLRRNIGNCWWFRPDSFHYFLSSLIQVFNYVLQLIEFNCFSFCRSSGPSIMSPTQRRAKRSNWIATRRTHTYSSATNTHLHLCICTCTLTHTHTHKHFMASIWKLLKCCINENWLYPVALECKVYIGLQKYMFYVGFFELYAW